MCHLYCADIGLILLSAYIKDWNINILVWTEGVLHLCYLVYWYFSVEYQPIPISVGYLHTCTSFMLILKLKVFHIFTEKRKMFFLKTWSFEGGTAPKERDMRLIPNALVSNCHWLHPHLLTIKLWHLMFLAGPAGGADIPGSAARTAQTFLSPLTQPCGSRDGGTRTLYDSALHHSIFPARLLSSDHLKSNWHWRRGKKKWKKSNWSALLNGLDGPKAEGADCEEKDGDERRWGEGKERLES